jgi:hypothetical protein
VGAWALRFLLRSLVVVVVARVVVRAARDVHGREARERLERALELSCGDLEQPEAADELCASRPANALRWYT